MAGAAAGALGVAAGALAATALAVQLAPAISGVRWARNRYLPELAGVGVAGHIALTFDDGPDRASTPSFLDALDDLEWKATFFMLATMARSSPDLVAEVAKRGHEVAVHGSRHSNHLGRGPAWVSRDMLAARDLLGDLTGQAPRWVRPPYGAVSSSTLWAARRASLQTVLWTTWGRDWRARATRDSIVADVQATLVPGATVLLHDSDCTSAPGSWKATLATLPLLSELWTSAGLRVGTLSTHGLAEPAMAA
ncbi:MAG TPA: polysaccharide deacetylase family protein [Acidimicrobiales bacterium]|nr:polysaccharide deacetylase family protein [Acidimicrobiales bacterium]